MPVLKDKGTLKMPPSLVAGKPYRLNDMARVLNRNRATIEKYIKKLSLKTTKVEHFGRKVMAVILTEKNIEQLLVLSQGVEDEVDLLPQNDEEELEEAVEEPVKPVEYVNDLPQENLSMELFKYNLEVLQQHQAQKDQLFQQIIQSKESEISTLKTALVIAERHSNQIAVNIAPRPMGLLGKLKEKLGLT